MRIVSDKSFVRRLLLQELATIEPDSFVISAKNFFKNVGTTHTLGLVWCFQSGHGRRLARHFGGFFSSNKSVPANRKKGSIQTACRRI
jgi:hypothetical protein